MLRLCLDHIFRRFGLMKLCMCLLKVTIEVGFGSGAPRRFISFGGLPAVEASNYLRLLHSTVPISHLGLFRDTACSW